MKIGGLKTRYRIRALNHRTRVLVLTEAVHVILGDDTKRTHFLFADIIRIIVGDKHVRQRRKRLFPFRLGIDPVEIASEGVSHPADKQSMLFVRVVTLLLRIVLTVDLSIRRECLPWFRNADFRFVVTVSVGRILIAGDHPCRRIDGIILAEDDLSGGIPQIPMGIVSGRVDDKSVFHRTADRLFVAIILKLLRRAVVLEDEAFSRSALHIPVLSEFLGASRLAPKAKIMNRASIGDALAVSFIRLKQVDRVL